MGEPYPQDGACRETRTVFFNTNYKEMTNTEIIQAIEQRHSCRSFTGACLPEQILDELKEYIEKDDNLLLIDGVNGRVGTYGIVSGSAMSIAVSGDEKSAQIMDTASSAERIVLWLTSKGIGSVWLGGTFRVSGIDRHIQAVIAIGIPKAKAGFLDRIMRKSVSSNTRKPFDELFKAKDGDFGDFRQSLEMMRLAPSACNAQPWRAYTDGDMVHFYCVTDNKYTYLDMGIALCHFCLTAGEGGLFSSDAAPTIFNGAKYITSWKKS